MKKREWSWDDTVVIIGIILILTLIARSTTTETAAPRPTEEDWSTCIATGELRHEYSEQLYLCDGVEMWRKLD